MVQGRSIMAGTVGVVCAIAVLGFIALSQSGTTSNGGSSLNQVGEFAGVQNTTHSSSAFGNAASLAPESPQSVENPRAISSVALLGGVSLLVGLGVAVFVSRRLG